jgi:ethanolamine utilization protein EutQ (cupin superfamily)
MTTTAVSVPRYSADNDSAFGPAMIEHRTADSGLPQLGTYFMVFNSDKPSEPWTLQYDETIFVIEGEARLVVLEDGRGRVVTAAAGELVVLPRGSTVRYAASIGTRFVRLREPVLADRPVSRPAE